MIQFPYFIVRRQASVAADTDSRFRFAVIIAATGNKQTARFCLVKVVGRFISAVIAAECLKPVYAGLEDLFQQLFAPFQIDAGMGKHRKPRRFCE